MIILYHGSPTASYILQHGIDINYHRRSDPGDFGWGFYLTGNLSRAKVKGGKIDNVLDITINESTYAFLPHPYFLDKVQHIEPKTKQEKLFYGIAFDPDTKEMKTIKGSKIEMETTSKKIRQVFLANGYGGIITPHHHIEAVVFDLNTVKDIRPHTSYA